MTYLPLRISVLLASTLALAYFLCYLFSVVTSRGVYSIACTIGFSSLNIGFGVHLLLLLCGVYAQAAEGIVRNYGVSLFLGSLTMLVTGSKDILRLFRLDTRLRLLRHWLQTRVRRGPTRVLVL